MSTIFEVWPSLDVPITAEQFLEELQAVFLERCVENGVETQPILEMNLVDYKTNKRVPFVGQSQMEWHDSKYLWLSIKGLSGGTDISWYENDDFDKEYWRSDVISSRPKGIAVHDLEASLEPGFHWSFRRSAGQPSAINILYGLAAGCLATLSAGFVFSGDGAWDYSRLPMTGMQLLDEYMRPWKITNKNFHDWSIRCSQAMREELAHI